jgi:hypothetical protein
MDVNMEALPYTKIQYHLYSILMYSKGLIFQMTESQFPESEFPLHGLT